MTAEGRSRFVLRDDVRFVPMDDLDPEIRERIDCPQDHVAVSRLGARTASTVVDPEGAALLEQFRKPRTLIEALILYARRRELDAPEVLEDAVELVDRFVRQRVLRELPPGDERAPPSETDRLTPGERLALPSDPDGRGAWNGRGRTVHVIQPVAVLEDVEVALVRIGEEPGEGEHAALKIRRPDAPPAASLSHEAAILEHLEGAGGAVRLLLQGRLDGRRFLLLEWCGGRDAESAAAELRGPVGGRRELLTLLRSIVGAYAELHRRGVFHGDVHARNLLVEDPASVRLIDFGLSRRADGAGPPRGGVGFFYEPEWAQAMGAGEPPPPATAAGEQYAVGALLYLLSTGAHRQDFSLGRDEMLDELSTAVPLPFERRGIEPWPDLEAVLSRTLAIDPGERFSSMEELAQALEDVSVPPRRRAPSLRASRLAALERDLLGRLEEGSPWLEEGLPLVPTASVNYGAAGIALGLYRIAGRRQDPHLLALAERWVDRAARSIGEEAGFYREEIEITPRTVGRASPFHSPSGVHAVRAWIARAAGDPAGQGAAVGAFLDAAQAPAAGLDLTLGRGGLVLAAAFLLDALPQPLFDPDPLRSFGKNVLAEIWRELDSMGPILDSPVDSLGAAHGWAGFLHLTFEWCRAAGEPLPAGLPGRLDQLAELARPAGRGLRWPWQNTAAGGTTMPGWCNGSAGYVPLWLHAHRRSGDDRFFRLAEAAAWDCWDAPDPVTTLCCGLAGRAWALLALHRATGGGAWLRRARVLADRAAASGGEEDEYPWSLYKGAFGLVVLAADLERPQEAAQPLFESEGWPPPVSQEGRSGRSGQWDHAALTDG